VNDTFSQASKVIRYGLEYNRIIYFQTFDCVFKGKFNEIFSLINTRNRIIFDELPDELKFFLNKKKKYTKYRNVIYSDSGIPVTFDFEKDHVDDILCHDQFGGGSNGYEFLKYFEPKDIIKNKIKDFQNKYKNQYDGIHIRCTDIQTDYKKNLQKLMTKNFKYIFVCSDSDDVLVHANQIIPQKKLLQSSISRSKTLKNLHIESDFSESHFSLHPDLVNFVKNHHSYMVSNDYNCVSLYPHHIFSNHYLYESFYNLNLNNIIEYEFIIDTVHSHYHNNIPSSTIIHRYKCSIPI